MNFVSNQWVGRGGLAVWLNYKRILDNICPCRSLLDMGCGCGILGLLAKDYTERLTLVDIDEQAVTFARHNAAETATVIQADIWNVINGQFEGPYDTIIGYLPLAFNVSVVPPDHNPHRFLDRNGNAHRRVFERPDLLAKGCLIIINDLYHSCWKPPATFILRDTLVPKVDFREANGDLYSAPVDFKVDARTHCIRIFEYA